MKHFVITTMYGGLLVLLSLGTVSAGSFNIDEVLATKLSACKAAPTGTPLKIGYAADFSDLGGFADKPASQAALYFVELVNCAGGVDGSPIKLIIKNIEGNPEVTQRVGHELMAAGVSAMLGPPFPDFGEPLLQVTAGKVATLFVASTEPMLANSKALSYLVAFDDTAQATAAAKFALQQGWRTAVTFSAPGPYFGYNPKIFSKVFKAGGGSITADYNFVPIDDMDFSTQANKMASAGKAPDVVYSAMLSFQSAVLRGQLDAAGVKTNYLVTDAFEATGGYFTKGVEGFYHTTHSYPAEGSRVKILADGYQAAKGAPLENASFGGLAVDALAVIISAFQSSGSMDPKILGAAIANADGVEGATSNLSYSGANGAPSKPVFVHRVVDGAPTLAATIQ
ncbi:MAG: ABC transporter substrate-binding protein [Candidatus Marinimicrobia bacterium]|jgi:branched-chain amino acid transport system substrate-binding protein|nr:ABC transporter substrate-binding protein [Candidatus Neomarinimicrobiota bacterium]